MPTRFPLLYRSFNFNGIKHTTSWFSYWSSRSFEQVNNNNNNNNNKTNVFHTSAMIKVINKTCVYTFILNIFNQSGQTRSYNTLMTFRQKYGLYRSGDWCLSFTLNCSILNQENVYDLVTLVFVFELDLTRLIIFI